MQEKKLRDALEEIACKTVYGEADGTEEQKRIDRLHSIAVTALASTTDETEMEKLRQWLEGEIAYAEEDSGSIVRGHWADFCGAMLRHITTQFGEEE